MLKRIWADPVGSKVIAAAILGVTALTGSYFLNWWPIIWPRVFGFLGGTFPVWNWLLILWVLATLAVASWFARRFHRDSQIPAWQKHYMSDMLNNLKFRWKYNDAGSIVDLKCYCRKCSCEIVPSLPAANGRVSFICSNCKSDFRPGICENWTDNNWKSVITRMIQKKIDTNEWASDTAS